MSGKKRKMEKISVEEIPANVMETVDQIMPGGTIEKAGKWERKDKVIYKVKKSVEAGNYVITVTADGVLLEVVREGVRRRRRRHSSHRRHSHKHHGSHHEEVKNENSGPQGD